MAVEDVADVAYAMLHANASRSFARISTALTSQWCMKWYCFGIRCVQNLVAAAVQQYMYCECMNHTLRCRRMSGIQGMGVVLDFLFRVWLRMHSSSLSTLMQLVTLIATGATNGILGER